MCLAQGHNAVTSVRFEPVAPQSQVKHSTTEQMGSPQSVAAVVNKIAGNYIKYYWKLYQIDGS